jgi:hypothetical protein
LKKRGRSYDHKKDNEEVCHQENRNGLERRWEKSNDEVPTKQACAEGDSKT